MGHEARTTWADPGWRVELAARAAPVSMLVLAGVTTGAFRNAVLGTWLVSSAAVAGLMVWHQRPLWRPLPLATDVAVGVPLLGLSVSACAGTPNGLTAAAVAISAASLGVTGARSALRRFMAVHGSGHLVGEADRRPS